MSHKSAKRSSGVSVMMLKMTLRSHASLAAAALICLVAGSAAGDGVVVTPRDIPSVERAQLAQQIAESQQREPASFAAVAAVKGHLPEQYMKFRNPAPSVARELRRLGPDALLPMLNALAFDAPARNGATDAEWETYQIGLLDAVGRLRDPRAENALHAALRNTTGDVAVAAAEAVGRNCTDASLNLLQAAVEGPQRRAAIAGLGQCRRVEAAETLATALKTCTDADEAEHIALALGRVASSWAWQALGSAHEQTGLRVRGIASRALVASLSRFGGNARGVSERALQSAAHPELRAIVLELDPRGELQLESTIRSVE